MPVPWRVELLDPFWGGIFEPYFVGATSGGIVGNGFPATFSNGVVNKIRYIGGAMGGTSLISWYNTSSLNFIPAAADPNNALKHLVLFQEVCFDYYSIFDQAAKHNQAIYYYFGTYNYSQPAFTWSFFFGYSPITSGIYTIGQYAAMPLSTIQEQFVDPTPYHWTHDGPGPNDGGANTPNVADDQMTRTDGHF